MTAFLSAMDVVVVSRHVVHHEHWERKRKQYLGDPVFPDKAVVDWGRTQQPLQLRVVVWRSLLWQQHQCNLNTVCNDIMLAALADEDIMPIHRYRQARRAFNVYLNTYASTSLVKSYRQLMAMRVKLWQNCITAGIKQAEESFFDADVVSRPERHLTPKKFLQYLQPLHVGCVRLDGTVNQAVFADSQWDMKQIFSWM